MNPTTGRRETGPDKLFVITGGNSGLGLETARNILALSEANEVILACRDLSKAAGARRSLIETTGNSRVRAMHLELSSLDSVRDFASKVSGPVDALVCNAGISTGPKQTVDGIDGVFETNHLGHFLLTLSLMDRMAPNGRVLAVSSDMHRPPGPQLRWPGAEELARPDQRARVALLRYSYSKLCNLYFVYELSRRLRATDSGVSSVAFNPGLMTDTNFAKIPRALGAVMRRVFAQRLGNLGESSRALSQLATDAITTEVDGGYFDRTAQSPTRSSVLSYDLDNARGLWDLSVHLTNADL